MICEEAQQEKFQPCGEPAGGFGLCYAGVVCSAKRANYGSHSDVEEIYHSLQNVWEYVGEIERVLSVA